MCTCGRVLSESANKISYLTVSAKAVHFRLEFTSVYIHSNFQNNLAISSYASLTFHTERGGAGGGGREREREGRREREGDG